MTTELDQLKQDRAKWIAMYKQACLLLKTAREHYNTADKKLTRLRYDNAQLQKKIIDLKVRLKED